MVINPSAEIYLLDTKGNILGHNLPTETVLTSSVDLNPVLTLIGGQARFPLYGDDPRNSSTQKVFSAWPVTSDSVTEGYLYVVLGGQKYEMLANNIGDTYAAKASITAIVTIALFPAIVGLLVFGLPTRRLQRLYLEMR